MSIELFDMGKSQSKPPFSLRSDCCTINLIILSKDLISFKNNCIYFASSEDGPWNNAVNSLHFESMGDEFYAETEDGRQCRGDGCNEQLDEDKEHIQLFGIRTQFCQVNEINYACEQEDDVDKVNSLPKELLLVFALVSNGPQIFATKSIEVSLSHKADYFWNTFTVLLNRSLLGISMVPPHGPLPILNILDFDDFCAKIEQKPLLVLLLIGKVLDFLLPDQIIVSSAILLVNQGFSP